MVIEHSFVTTLEPMLMLRQAHDCLAARGFICTQGTEPIRGKTDAWSIEMKRGKDNPARAKHIVESPQVARVEYDRGRVSLAVSIVAPRKNVERHILLLKGIVHGLESLLSCTGPGAADYEPWDRAEADALAAARRRQNRLIAVVVLLFLSIFLITLLAVFGPR